MTNEEKLLMGLKRRKRGCLERAIELYTPYVGTVIYNAAGCALSREDVEETVSDVFISLWKNVEFLDAKKGSIRAYIGAVARNCAKNKLRGIRVTEPLDRNESDNVTPDEVIETEERRKRLIELVRELGEPDGEIFFRYYWYDEKISSIAEATGLCVSTVKTKLARGRKRLKEILTGRCGDDETAAYIK